MSIIDDVRVRQNFGDKYEFEYLGKGRDLYSLNEDELLCELQSSQEKEDEYFATTYNKQNCRDLGFIIFRYFCECYVDLENGIYSREIVEKASRMLLKERNTKDALICHRKSAVVLNKKHFVYDYMIPLINDFKD